MQEAAQQAHHMAPHPVEDTHVRGDGILVFRSRYAAARLGNGARGGRTSSECSWRCALSTRQSTWKPAPSRTRRRGWCKRLCGSARARDVLGRLARLWEERCLQARELEQELVGAGFVPQDSPELKMESRERSTLQSPTVPESSTEGSRCTVSR